MKKTARRYFREYLKVAPLSLAIWRAMEAEAVGKIRYDSPILDIGCGFGEFAGVVFDRMIEVGIDISQKDLVGAGRKRMYKNLILADARELPFEKEKFQSIISISTLEHIEGVDRVFVEAYRILKPGGLFVFTVPTKAINKELMFPSVGLFHWTFKHKTIEEKEVWLSMAKRVGFKIENCRGTTTHKQVRAFELTLPLALPTQLFRKVFGRRLLYSPAFRIRLYDFLFKSLFWEREKTEANIIVVARK